MMSTYAVHKMLDLTLSGSAYTPPASVWLTFATGNIEPQDSSISELTIAVGGYARKQITFGAAAQYREVFNTAAINFPAPTADWGSLPVTWAVIMDAQTSGNWLFATPVCAKLYPSGAQPPNIPVSRLRVHLCYPGIYDYLANKWLDHLLRNTAFTAPASVQLALSTGVLSHEDASVTSEVSGGSYAKQTLTFAASAHRMSYTSAAVNFPAPTADWGAAATPIIAQAITDNGTNPLFYEQICAKTILNGDPATTYLAKAIRVASLIGC